MDQKWIAVLTAILSVGLVTTLAIGVGPPILMLLGVVGVIGLVSLWSMKRSGRPTEFLYGGARSKPWTWWTVLAAFLGLVYVVAGVGQLIDDPKATNVGALGISIVFAALIGVGLRFRSQSKIAGNWFIIFATTPALMFFWVVVPAVVGLAIIVGAVIEIARATPVEPLGA